MKTLDIIMQDRKYVILILVNKNGTTYETYKEEGLIVNFDSAAEAYDYLAKNNLIGKSVVMYNYNNWDKEEKQETPQKYRGTIPHQNTYPVIKMEGIVTKKGTS